jgi:hypothetical protein
MSRSGLREHLQEIYDRHGRLTPEIVVAETQPKNHPLHGQVYDRAPKEAAAAWYRHRAHELIQSVRISYRPHPDAAVRKVRAFHCIRTEANEYVYEPAEKVAEDPFMRSLVLRDMEREWKTLQRRYGEFEEFVSLVASDLGLVA